MPKRATADPNRVADLVKGGGLKPDMLKKRELAWKSLDEFVREQYKITADDAIKSSCKLTNRLKLLCLGDKVTE